MSEISASTEPTILLLCPTGRDGPLTQKVLSGAGIPSRLCATLSELCAAMRDQATAAAAVIAEEGLVPSDALSRLLDAVRQQPVWSDLPLIVLNIGPQAGRATRHLAEHLQPLTNVTFLERPLRVLTFVSTVRTALRARRRQHQVRDLLAQAQEQVKQRDRFLALLGHELRNPLAAIRTAIEVLDNVRGDDRAIAEEQRRVIVRQTGNLAHLVDDLLDVARITAGKIALNRRTLDLIDVVRQGISSVKLALRRFRQQLSLHVPEEPLYVNADPVRLEQVMTNLLGNAAKYTQDDGSITITVERQESHAIVRVKDNGIGMPRDTLPHIFEPFYRVDSPQSLTRGGLGLGLAVVRGLIELHGGSITAGSDGPGKGSEFAVSLPLVAAPASYQESPESKQPPTRRDHRSVLVVEDADDARRAMTTLLRLWGHCVESVEDGHAGVRRAVESRPDVALVDIGLPGIDGYEVARQIRLLLGDTIHLVALTGYGQAEDKIKALEAGFDRHLVKPVDPQVLADVLTQNGKPHPH